MTLLATLKGTFQEILDSKKAVTLIFTVLTSLLANLGAILFAHLSKKFGLDPALADKVPAGAAYLSMALIGLAATYLHAQGRVDAATAQGVAAAAPAVGSPEFKAGLQGLALEAIKAGLDQHLPGAIQAALSKSSAPPTVTTSAGTVTVTSGPSAPPVS
jgi:hypothetical protein